MTTARRFVVCLAMLSVAAATALRDTLELRSAADEAYADGRFDGAAKLYEQLTVANPTHGHGFVRLGECYVSLNRAADAIVPLTRAIELGAIVQPDGLYQIARCHALSGRTEGALDYLSRAIAAGYRFRPRIASDKAFAALTNDPRFAELAGRVPLPPDIPRTDGYARDLDYLTSEIRRLHYLYRRQPLPVGYTELASELRTRLSSLSDERVTVEMQRLLATLGDGHTLLLPFGMKRGQLPRMPVAFYAFSDGLFIVDAAAQHAGLIGAKVLQIGGRPPEELLKDLEPYVPRDNPMGIVWSGPVYLTFPHFLQAAGAAIPEPARVPVTVTTADRDRREVTIMAVAPVDPDQIAIKLAPARSATTRPTTFRPDANFFLHDLSDRAVYMQFNQVQNSADETLAAFAKRLRDHLDQRKAETLILDLRHNNGGEGSLLREFQQTLVHFETSRSDARLYVVIGRTTFSAAQQLASFLSHHTSAIFVGEPTGSRPNRPGDESPVVLPYSGIRVSVASGYHQAASKDERIWIAPDLPVGLSSADHFAGRDPAIDAILARLPKQP